MREPFLIYPPQMHRRHLFNALSNTLDISYLPEDFGPVKTLYIKEINKEVRLIQLLKNTSLYRISNGENFILNADNSNKCYVIDETIEKYQGLDSRKIILPQPYEGEIIGSIMYNPSNFDLYHLYNFRLCLNFFLYLHSEFPESAMNKNRKIDPIGIKTQRSELVSYTRANYYQLREIFPSLKRLSIQNILSFEKDGSTRRLYDLYVQDINNGVL